MIAHSDVAAAAARIAGRVRRTPLLEVDPAPLAPAARMWLKLELTQHTGSFKARGAFNHVLAAREEGRLPDAGIVAASGGNAGLAFAYAASRSGAPAEVFVPETAPAVKVALLRALGAAVTQVGARYAEAQDAAQKRAAETGALFCHAYDLPEVCAGQGTLGLEILEQTGGEIDTVLLSVGGGGLMAGVVPEMNGFEFAEAVRSDQRLAGMPIIALSSVVSPAAIERGRQAGFHDYVAKFDRPGLIAALKEQTTEFHRAA